MDAQDRLSQILTLARDRGRVDVSTLAPELGVAPETVRRDLAALVSRGLLRRVHGGAIPAESAAFETDAGYRAQANVAQKRRIAAASARLLEGAESVFIDEGFGSLDSESLEHVMDVLGELASGDCLVGIISHVEELESRVGNRIEVAAGPEGSHATVVCE